MVNTDLSKSISVPVEGHFLHNESHKKIVESRIEHNIDEVAEF